MAFCFILKLKIFLIYLLSLVFSCCTTPCHSLSLIEIFITRCHWLVVTGCLSLPFVVTWFITHYHSLSLVVTCCHSLCHRLSFVVTRYHSLYHSMSFVRHALSLDVPLISLFINDRFFIAFDLLCQKNPRVAMGMIPNCSARYELTYRVSFYLISFEVITSQREEKLRINFCGHIWNYGRCVRLNQNPYMIKRNCHSKCKMSWFSKFGMFRLPEN